MFLNIETLGIMAFVGIKLDAVAIICLVMSIGLSFDYIGHVGHAFLHEKGSTNAKRVETSMGKPLNSQIPEFGFGEWANESAAF